MADIRSAFPGSRCTQDWEEGEKGKTGKVLILLLNYDTGKEKDSNEEGANFRSPPRSGRKR